MNNYDLQMGLAPVDFVGFIIGVGICLLVGWLITK